MAGLDHEWLAFVGVAAGELALFAFLARRRRVPLAAAVRALVFGLPAGLLIGLAMDLFLGRQQGVFAYRLDQDLAFLVLNGLCGYGPAVATAWLFPVSLGELPRSRSRATAAGAGAGAVIVLGIEALLPLPALASAFLLGGAVLLLGEAVCAALARSGPLVEAMSGKPGAAARLWLYSALVGALYELLNWVWPVWQWRILDSSPASQEALMIVLGYVVLFHPLVVVSRLALGPSDP